MSKYDPLQRHLARRTGDEIPMTFSDVERILGFALPPSARLHQPWWSNNVGTHVAARAWRSAGFKTARLDLAAERVTFVREAGLDAASGMAEPRSQSFGHDIIRLSRSAMSKAARHLVDDYVEETGLSAEAAVAAMLDSFAIQRRRELLESFAHRGATGGGDSVGLIREDRDGR